MAVDPFRNLSPTVRALLRQSASRRAGQPDEYETMSEAETLERLGAPEADVERARRAESVYGVGGLRNVTEFAGIEPRPPREGFVEKAFKVLTAPQSAVTGFVTGLAGLERERVTAEEGRMLSGGPVEGGMGLALERFFQGITGQEQFRAADFGALAYDRETAGTSERALKSAMGFVLDVALDPLTYMSFGGSVMGRARGAEALAQRLGRRELVREVAPETGEMVTRRLASNREARRRTMQALTDAGQETQERVIVEAFARGGVDTTILARTLREEVPDLLVGVADDALAGGTMKVDEALSVLRQSPETLLEAASDALASTAAGLYESMGRGAAYSYLSSLGNPGKALWRSLPNDIKGGVRVRVPFSKYMQSSELGARVPYALRIPGTEVLGEKLPIVSNLSNKARSFIRRTAMLSPLGRGLDGKLSATKLANRQALYARNVEIAKKGLFGELDEGALKFATPTPQSWEAKARALAREADHRVSAMGAHAQMMEDFHAAAASHAEGLTHGADYETALAQAARERVIEISHEFDSPRLAKTVEEVFQLKDADASPAQVAAYQTMQHLQAILERHKFSLIELSEGDTKRAVEILENYWPRVMEEMADEVEKIGGLSSYAPSLRQRSGAYVAIYNDEGGVLNYMTPWEIAEQEGIEIFKKDPLAAIGAYARSMGRVIESERFLKSLVDDGVLFRGGQREIFKASSDVSKAREAFLEGYGRMQQSRSRLRATGRAKRRLSDMTEDGRVLTGRALEAEVADAVAVVQALGPAVAGARKFGLNLYQVYRPVSRERGLFRSIDDTIIRTITDDTGQMMYQVSAPVGKQSARQFLGKAGRFVNDPGSAQMFMTFDEARQAADFSMRLNRRRDFIRRVAEMQEEFEANVALTMRSRKWMRRNGVDPAVLNSIENPLDPRIVPQDMQKEYFAKLSEVIHKWGGDAQMQNRRAFARNYGTAYSVGGEAGYRPLGVGGPGPEMSQYWRNRMESLDLFAPETLHEDINRMFRAFAKPNDFAKWVNDFYKPLYSVQKAFMTRFRGPGYVARNLSGGMYNGYVVGTTKRHFRLAAVAQLAEMKAHSAAVNAKLTPGTREFGEFMKAEFEKVVNGRLGARLGRKVTDAYEAFYARGLSGRSAASQTIGIEQTAGLGSETLMRGKDVGSRAQRFAQAVSTGETATGREIAGWYQWANFMGGLTQTSENFLRLSVFLKGIDDFGLEDGGRAASMLVKATQFDYSDLSDIEANVVKMIIPFYTWTRQNVPLQFRAIMHEPGRINKLLRLNEGFRDAFGEPEEPGEPLPSYVRERFGWRIRTDALKDWGIPELAGPSGDPLSIGLVAGEPLVDVNRLFGSPTGIGAVRGPMSMLNWRELANQTAPVFSTSAEFLSQMEATTGGALPREEEATPLFTFFARRTPDGERVVSARGARAVRELLPPIGMVERYAAPLLGNERLQRRWYTSLASGIFGLPVSTLDPFQVAGELRTEERRLSAAVERQMGESAPTRTAWVRRLLQLGASPEEMQILRDTVLGGQSIVDVPIEQVDQWAAVDTLAFIRRMAALREAGTPEDIIRQMADSFTPRTDEEMGVRAGAAQPLTPEQLAEEGLTPEDVAALPREQRLDLLRKYAEQ